MLSVSSFSFPDVDSGLSFEPVEVHAEFCREYSVGINLLHSHHGVSEMYFFDNFNKSRPATDEDKSIAIPCSFFVDKATKTLVPFEWTADCVRPMPAAKILPSLIETLSDLEIVSGVSLGFTLREVRDVTEFEFADQPGWHCFIPTLSTPAVNDSERRSLITNFDVRPETGGPVYAGCEMYTVTRCVSNASNGYSHETIYSQRHG